MNNSSYGLIEEISGKELGIILTTFAVGIFSSIYVISLINKNAKKSAEIDIPKNEKPKLRKDYYYKYKDLYENLSENNVDDVDFEFKFMKETTELEDCIIIGYNKLGECFDVWYDNNKIQFFELDTLAQLFAIEYDCKEICIDYKKEFDIAREKMIENLKNEKKNLLESESENSLFAKFKDYNTKIKKEEKKVLPERSNRFRHCGKLNFWNGLYEKHGEWKKAKNGESAFIWVKNKSTNKDTSNNTTETLNEISWNDWKKNIKN